MKKKKLWVIMFIFIFIIGIVKYTSYSSPEAMKQRKLYEESKANLAKAQDSLASAQAGAEQDRLNIANIANIDGLTWKGLNKDQRFNYMQEINKKFQFEYLSI